MRALLNTLFLILSLQAMQACGNDSSNTEPAESETIAVPSQQTAATGDTQNPAAMTSEKADSRLIPIQLLESRFEKMPPSRFGSNSDTVDLIRLQYENKSRPSLQLSVERISDAARLKRMLQTWTYHPDKQESFSAGDEAVILFTKEKSTHYYTLVFRVNDFFASIVSDNDAGNTAAAGMLFSATELKKLAADWATHLQNLKP